MTGGTAERLVLLLICLSDDLDDLAVGLIEVGILTVDGCPSIQTVQGLGDADEGVIRSLHIIPLLELDGVLLVHELCVLEQLVPVVLNAVLLLNECNAILEHLGGIRMCARLVVDHSKRYGEVGHADTAALEH